MSPRFENQEDFDSKGYVKVNERLQEFRTKYPDGMITTFRTVDDYGISFRTVVARTPAESELYAKTGLAASTGHSYLPDEVNGEKMEEYAETVSVGRALANLGIKVTEGIASQEEMDQYKRKVDDAGQDEKPKAKKTEDEEDGEEDSRFSRFSKNKDSEDEEEEDAEAGEDDNEDDEEADEPKLRSSRKFSNKKTSRFGS